MFYTDLPDSNDTIDWLHCDDVTGRNSYVQCMYLL